MTTGQAIEQRATGFDSQAPACRAHKNLCKGGLAQNASLPQAGKRLWLPISNGLSASGLRWHRDAKTTSLTTPSRSAQIPHKAVAFQIDNRPLRRGRGQR